MTINDANSRISNLFEKACLALLSLFVSIMFISYQGINSDYKEMQATITQLQMIKVNKEDLREVEVRLNTKIESIGATLSANSMANKADILGRMDLYFGSLKNRK